MFQQLIIGTLDLTDTSVLAGQSSPFIRGNLSLVSRDRLLLKVIPEAA